MASFLERLRAPLLRGNGFGSTTAGESDSLDQAVSLSNLDRLLGGSLSGRSGRRNLGMRGGGQDDWIKRTAIQRRGLPAGVENVVYDQGPEQFNKKLALEDKSIDAKIAQTEMLNAIRQQQADATSQRAEAYDFGVRNPQGQVVTPRGGNATVIDRRTGRAIDTGVAGGTMTQEDELLQRAQAALTQGAQKIEGQQGLAGINNAARAAEGAANRDNRLAAIAAQSKGAGERQGDAQNFMAGRPRERSAALNNRVKELTASDPEIAQAIQWDGDNWQINPNLDDATRAVVTARIYGPEKKSINLGKGSDSSGLNQRVTPSQSTTVPMIAPDGRSLNVPTNRVAEMEARGAKRR